MSVKNGWIPVKEDPDLQIKHREKKPITTKQVDENLFQIKYLENEKFQVGRDGTSIVNYQVPPGKKFDVNIHVIITDI